MMTDRERLGHAVGKWRRSEPGTVSRKEAADEIEELEGRVFGTRPHALGEPLDAIEATRHERRERDGE